MRLATLCFLSAAILVGGCDQAEQAMGGTGAQQRGRYQGIGTFAAGELWQHITDANVPIGASAARLADDEQIIVVIDSHTGEVRQCGNHSGYCVAMNPWSGGAAISKAPVNLTRHAQELDEANTADAESRANPSSLQDAARR